MTTRKKAVCLLNRLPFSTSSICCFTPVSDAKIGPACREICSSLFVSMVIYKTLKEDTELKVAFIQWVK